MNERIKPLTIEDVRNACLIEDTPTRSKKVGAEISSGLAFIRRYKKSVSFFGSTRLREESPDYQKARSLAGKIVKDTGYAVVTGGGPGIMEAGNRGAKE